MYLQGHVNFFATIDEVFDYAFKLPHAKHFRREAVNGFYAVDDAMKRDIQQCVTKLENNFNLVYDTDDNYPLHHWVGNFHSQGESASGEEFMFAHEDGYFIVPVEELLVDLVCLLSSLKDVESVDEARPVFSRHNFDLEDKPDTDLTMKDIAYFREELSSLAEKCALALADGKCPFAVYNSIAS